MNKFFIVLLFVALLVAMPVWATEQNTRNNQENQTELESANPQDSTTRENNNPVPTERTSRATTPRNETNPVPPQTSTQSTNQTTAPVTRPVQTESSTTTGRTSSFNNELEQQTNTRQETRQVEADTPTTPEPVWESQRPQTETERREPATSTVPPDRSAVELRQERMNATITRNNSGSGTLTSDNISSNNRSSGILGYTADHMQEVAQEINLSPAPNAFVQRYIQEYREEVAELYEILYELLAEQKEAMIENNFDKVGRLELTINSVRMRINVIRIVYLEKIYDMLSWFEREEFTNAGFSL